MLAEQRSEREPAHLALLAAAPAAIFVLDQTGRCTFVNERWCELVGVAPDDAAGGGWRATVHGPDRAAVDSAWEAAGATGDELGLEFRIVRPGGEHVWVAEAARPFGDAGGTVGGWIGTATDVTARRTAEDAARVLEAEMRETFDTAPIGMAITTLDGTLEHVNASFRRLAGRRGAELVGLRASAVVHPADRGPMRERFAGLLAGERERMTARQRLIRADGEVISVELQATVLRTDDGSPVRVLCQVLDISGREAAERRLRELAERDDLTGLLNRRAFRAELERHLRRAQRYGPDGAVLVIDLDNFKHVNDTLGHEAGDRVLERAAATLESNVRSVDVLARLGGDEFAVLLGHSDAATARVVAGKLCAALREQFTGGVAHRITASIGIAEITAPIATRDRLLALADAAMYQAKAAGRNRCVTA